MPIVKMYDAVVSSAWRFDFGQHGFTYAIPAGHKRLCSADLPPLDNAIKNGNKGFASETYIGTGDDDHAAITDLEFSPDLVWIKSRDLGHVHYLLDTVRGASWNIFSNAANAQSEDGSVLKSFDSNGFTVGVSGGVNTDEDNLISWSWKRDPAYGFDIVPYEGTGVGRTIAHNLGVPPEMYIVKRLTGSAANWVVFHNGFSFPATEFLRLNTTGGQDSGTTIWNNTLPTSSVFSIGSHPTLNANGEDFITYLFASVPGFSKVFKYTGNGLEDGPFIDCGFAPSYVFVKSVNSTNWTVWDNKRQGYNPVKGALAINTAGTEDSVNVNVDLLSNGFKIRADSAWGFNATGVKILGIAFAERPLNFANAR
jgi:hypothetical protein